MRFLRTNGRPEIDVFKQGAYAEFRLTLDAEMKRLQQTGLGSTKRQAEPLTEAEEEFLWTSGVLGDLTLRALFNTVFFPTESVLLYAVGNNTVACTLIQVRSN